MYKDLSKNNDYLKSVLYISFFAATFGSEAIGFSFFGFNMSPVRILILITILMTILKKKVKVVTSGQSGYTVKFMTFWTLYSFVTLLWAKNNINGIKVCVIIMGITLFLFCMMYIFDSDEDVLHCIQAFSLGCFIQCIIGWREIFTGIYKYASQEYGYVGIYTKYRMPVAMWSNVNNFATVMIFGCIASYIAFACAKNKFSKILYLVILINCALLILESQSRANIISLCIFATVLLFLAKKSKFFIIPAIIVVALYIPNLAEYVKSSFHIDIVSSNSDSLRWMFIKDGFGFLFDTAGFGVGAGQVASWSIAKRGSLGGQMHNWWIEILVSFGIVIFILYIINYIKMFLANRDIFNSCNDSTQKVISSSFLAFLLCFIFAGISSSSLMINEPMWIMFDLVITFIYISKEKFISE